MVIAQWPRALVAQWAFALNAFSVFVVVSRLAGSIGGRDKFLGVTSVLSYVFTRSLFIS
jgi:hypothetical protein